MYYKEECFFNDIWAVVLSMKGVTCVNTSRKSNPDIDHWEQIECLRPEWPTYVAPIEGSKLMDRVGAREVECKETINLPNSILFPN